MMCPAARRCICRSEVGGNGRAQELKDGTLPLSTRLNDSPDPFAPTTTILAASALGDTAVDGHKPNGLLCQVVSGFDVRFGDETKVAFGVVPKAFCQIAGLSAQRCSSRGIPYQLLTSGLQGTLEVLHGRVLFATMNHMKQASQIVQKELTVQLVLFVRMLNQELHVTNQVRQTKLQDSPEVVHVFMIRTEVVVQITNGRE